MMHLQTFTLLTLIATTLSSPAPTPPAKLEDRQPQGENIPQLLSLASLAGITAFPTNPAVILQLAPLASQLAAALPTSPVLSALETAAPSGFVSKIVHNPSYASSFESAFSAGHSPSWFNALPSSVRSYLHTYTGFAGIATAAAELNSITRNISATTTSASQTSMSSGMSTSMSSTSDAQAAGASTASSSTASSSSSQGGAAGPTGMIGAGIAGVFGVLGVAAVL